MLLAFVALVSGLALLVWSADKFVGGAAAVSKHFGISPLFIGMVIIGFGTSAPEMVVSAMSSMDGNPDIALGNAYGSNITNIALILGLTAILKPVNIFSTVLKKEMPILIGITLLSIFLISDLFISRTDAVILMLVFSIYMIWSSLQSMKKDPDALAKEMEQELKEHEVPVKTASINLILGLILLIISSRALVWGAVEIATALGVSNVIIGLTIVAVGTSLPELASSIAAAKKGEPDIVIGNILGSNLFNTLTVVGIAALIKPLAVDNDILYRDVTIMTALTLLLFVFGLRIKGQSQINRVHGIIFLAIYAGYTTYLISTVLK